MLNYFHFGIQDTFLFQNLIPSTAEQFFGIWLFSFLLAISQQALSSLTNSFLINNEEPFIDKSMHSRIRREFYFIKRAFLHSGNTLIGYLLMLLAMTFNLGILIAIVLGVFVGCFAFRRHDYERF
jgi:hypothetical protein